MPGGSSIKLLNAKALRETQVAFCCLALIAICQLILSYDLRFANYFNDDLEPIAAGFYLRSLYVTQFSVHLPMQAILSHWWMVIAGATPASNRLFAGLSNVGIEALMLLIGKRVGGYFTGLLAAMFYICLELNFWSYLNLSELPSVLFVLCSIYFGLNFVRPTLEIQIVRPFWFGVFLSLSFLSRFMALPLIGCVALLPLINSSGGQKIRRNALLAGTGFAFPMALTCIYFAAIGNFGAFMFWAFLYNFSAKSHIVPIAWIGDLSVPTIVNAWVLIGLALAATVACCAVAFTSKTAICMRGFLICWLPAFGGWLGANPSGIGVVAFHAIPALPFLCLGFSFGITSLWGEPLFLQSRILWLIRFGAQGAAMFAFWPFFQNTLQFAQVRPLDPHYDHARRVGAYIESHTRSSDCIFVFGADPLIYVSAHRNSGTEFSIVVDYVDRMQDRMLEELKRAHPAAVVFDKNDYWHYIDQRTFPKVAAYIAQNYRQSALYQDVLVPASPGAIKW